MFSSILNGNKKNIVIIISIFMGTKIYLFIYFALEFLVERIIL